jgi:hypothetical protein
VRQTSNDGRLGLRPLTALHLSDGLAEAVVEFTRAFYTGQLPDRGVDYDDITGPLLLGRTEREIRAKLDISVVEFIDAYLAGKLDRSDSAIEKFAIRFCIRHNT